MAQRFGGKYSPIPGMRGTGGSDPLPVPASQARHRFESRTKWVTIMASPLLMTAFFQGAPIEVATQIGGFGLIAAGMILTREGLQAEAAYDARRVARRPAVSIRTTAWFRLTVRCSLPKPPSVSRASISRSAVENTPAATVRRLASVSWIAIGALRTV